jgi:hypothetical protein
MRIRIPLVGITLHWGSKDGGPESRVFMYGIECKWAASALVLRFEDGSRDAFHSHAFNAISWVLNSSGALWEQIRGDIAMFHCAPQNYPRYLPWRERYAPIFTARECCHKVTSFGRTWVLTLRGPWQETWVDIDGATGEATTLRSGRIRAPHEEVVLR